MSISAHQRLRREHAQAELRERLRRVVITLLFIGGAGAGGALGILMAPHLDKILLVALLLTVIGLTGLLIVNDIRYR